MFICKCSLLLAAAVLTLATIPRAPCFLGVKPLVAARLRPLQKSSIDCRFKMTTPLPHIVIVGAGGVGSWLYASIADACRQDPALARVTLVARGAALARVREHGWICVCM